MAGIEETIALKENDNVDLAEKETERHGQSDKSERAVRLPLTRIKNIIKMDPEVALASSDAAILIAKATEFFIQDICKEAYTYTKDNKRKTMQKKDLDQAVDRIDTYAFLEDGVSSSIIYQWTQPHAPSLYPWQLYVTELRSLTLHPMLYETEPEAESTGTLDS